MLKSFLKQCSALVAVTSIANVATIPLASAQSVTFQNVANTTTLPIVTAQPSTTDQMVAQYNLDPTAAPVLPYAQMAALMRQKIKYVFVIFNENESFDHEYGTFPGANGIYFDGQNPRPAANTPGYFQQYFDSAGTAHMVTPFLVGPAENSNVMDSVDHSHTGLAYKLNVFQGVARMNGFAEDEYIGKAGASGVTAASDARGKQFANLVMSHIDCRTIPFFWQYANRFTLFDNIFATEDTPSTPNAVAMIAGQSGETQWVEHGSAGVTQKLANVTINGTNYNGQTATTQGPPLVNDPQPYWGSEFDSSVNYREPSSPSESYASTNIASNLTFANVLLTLAGTGIHDLLSADRNPASNEADIQSDITTIYNTGNNAKLWGWYQNGYDHEPYDTSATASHVGYVSHHQGPQYFGYLANDPNEMQFIHGEGDFFTDVANNNLSSGGGVFYIRGGYQNLQSLRSNVNNGQFPANAAATGGLTSADVVTIQTAKAGDDDHPSYSDHGITEAMNATVINAIASNANLWSQSAIIITYDESDGFWDHVPPRVMAYGPDSLPLSRGIRVPLLVISPYARTHVVSHAEGDHNAVIETINAIFNLPALSSLPNEAAALAAGNSAAFNQFAGVNAPAGFTQKFLGPRDTNSSITDSLVSAFDPRRLQGTAPILPASYAMIPTAAVLSLPHYGFQGCQTIGVVPEDQREGISAPPPATYNSLPSTLSKYNIPAPQ